MSRAHTSTHTQAAGRSAARRTGALRDSAMGRILLPLSLPTTPSDKLSARTIRPFPGLDDVPGNSGTSDAASPRNMAGADAE